jgi:hypothetical protein
MKILYFCDITQQDRVLYASKNFPKDKEFFQGYLERLGERLQLIELGESEIWSEVLCQ